MTEAERRTWFWSQWVTQWRADAERDPELRPRLEVLRGTPEETMLVLLRHPGTSFDWSHSRACGAEGRVGGVGFYCDVFQAAFLCYRRSLCSESQLEAFEKAQRRAEEAQSALAAAGRGLPVELVVGGRR